MARKTKKVASKAEEKKPEKVIAQAVSGTVDRLNSLYQVSKRVKGFRPAMEVLTKVRAHPTIFPLYDRATGVGGHPIERISVVHGPSNHGKSQPIDEPVLTPDGWRPIGSLKIGDQVIGSKGYPVNVVGVFPQGRLETLRIKLDDGRWTRCCYEHLWTTWTSNELNRGRYRRGPRPERKRIETGEIGSPSVKSTYEIVAAMAEGEVHYLPSMGKLNTGIYGLTECAGIDPYVLGLLLGDGSLTGSSPTFTSADAELANALMNEVVRRGDELVDATYGDRCSTWRIRGGRIISELRRLGCDRLSYDKHVPEECLWTSSEYRTALLQGLMDTDGCVTNEGVAAEFSSTSEALAQGVAFIARSLGGRAKIIEHETGHAPAWRVLVSNIECPFRLERKASEWKERTKEYRPRIIGFEESGEHECVCIKVDAEDELYVTRDFIVTHNTAFVHGLGLSFLRAGNFYAYIDAEFTSPEDWLRTLMRQYADHPGFLAKRPKSYEDTVDSVRDFVNTIAEARVKGEIELDTTALVVVDSIRKLVPEGLLKKLLKGDGGLDGASGRGAMMKAALNAQWLDELVPLLYHTKTALVFIAREYDTTPDAYKSVEPGEGKDYKVGGGRGLIFESSVVGRVTRTWVKDGTGESARVIGERHCVEITKTKVSGKQHKIERGYFHTSNGLLVPAGFDRARDVLELALDAGVVQQSGSWFSFDGERIGNGTSAAVKALTSNEALLDTIEGEARGSEAPEAPDDE